MPSLAELFPKCRKLAYDSRQQLAQVQNGSLNASELFSSLDELTKQLDTMNTLLVREPKAQRMVWKRKLDELTLESNGIRRQAEHFDKLVNTNLRRQNERNELLTRRRKGNNNMYSSSNERDMTNLSNEQKSLNQSTYMVNDLIANGEANLTSLREQREKMTGISKFMGQIDDKLGISKKTMEVIERRDITDAYFVAVGVAVTCLNIYIFWF